MPEGPWVVVAQKAICALVVSLVGASLVSAQAGEVPCSWIGPFQSAEAVLDPLDAASCAISPQPLCHWAFGYRDTGAVSQFEMFEATLTDCLGSPLAVSAPVNHPDTSLQVQFRHQGGVLVLALKDKAATSSSHVFLRLQQD